MAARFDLATSIVFIMMALVSTSSAQTPARVRLFQENISCPERLTPCGSNRNLALVFVHGLTGSKATWRHPVTSKYWPEMISRDASLRAYDVFRVDFDSFALQDSPSISQINAEFTGLMDRLEGAGYEHIAFVAHSLGGLVVQRHLTHVLNSGGHFALNRYRIAIFLGTPQEGSSFANYVSFLSANRHLRILRSYDVNDFAQLLQEGMQALTSKHDRQLCSTLRFFAAYEGKDTHGIRIVDRDSAVALSHACKEFTLDHTEISKPENESSDLYRSVKDLLVACAERKRNVCPRPRSSAGCLRPTERARLTDRARCELQDWSNALR